MTWTNDDGVSERPQGGLRLRINAMPYRPALHEDDRLMTVLARDGRRQSEHESSLRAAGDLFEAVGRQMVALIDDQMTVARRRDHRRRLCGPGFE